MMCVLYTAVGFVNLVVYTWIDLMFIGLCITPNMVF